jgi:PAS domain S-box-containing protein
MDRHGRTIRWNKAATALFGYSLSELKEKRVFDLYPEKEKLDKMLTDLRQKGYVRKYEINIQRKDGEVVPFEMSISLLKNKNGKVVGEEKLEECSSKLTKASEILQKSMKRIKDITDADE